jgi:branched-chain amino acid transport system substrate-binding protein
MSVSLRALTLMAALLPVTLLPIASAAADPYTINVLLPLTGGGAFIGTGEQKSLEAIEADVNRTGGIGGRPIAFAIADDQSNPQVELQLAEGIIAKHPPILIAGTLVAMCNAIAPLVKDGPVLYCTTPGAHPQPGSNVYSSSVSTGDLIAASLRYFRDRGLRRVAVITSTDASGHDADTAVDAAMALPENASVRVVDRQYFAPGDLTVDAQIQHIKASGADAIIAWTTGTPAATVFRAYHDAGLTAPLLTTNGNVTYAQMAQYAAFLPSQLLFAAAPCVAPEVVSGATRTAVNAYRRELNALGRKPDFPPSIAWDPALLTVAALRALGTNATAPQIRNYLDHLKGFVGVNGTYDFPAVPQRGVGAAATVIVRWDGAKQTFVSASMPGGVPVK